MSESDLDDALSNLDLGDAEGGEAADSGLEGLAEDLNAAAPAEEGGGGEGESVELDDDLQSALDSVDAGAGGGEGESVELDDDLQSALDSVDVGPGESVAGAEDAGGDDLADALNSLGGGEAPPPAREAPAHPAGLVGVDKDSVNVEFLLEIKLHVTFEVGRAKMLVSDLLTLGQGSVVELHRLVGDELDLLINGKLVAKGEVVVVNEKFGCRVSSIVPPEDRIKYLGGM